MLDPIGILEDSFIYPDYDLILNNIGDPDFVLLGESTHGTDEYYAQRANISKALIEKRNFSFIAVEGDWPDLYQVNLYIKGKSRYKTAFELLNDFKRWPTWMWANAEMIEFVEWLRMWNDNQADENKVGFYGLDLYSLWRSLEVIDQIFKEKHPELEKVLKNIFSCFQPYYGDEKGYAWSTRILPESCEREVGEIIRHLTVEIGSPRDEDELDLIQNAKVVNNAERYYRIMMTGGPDSWNLRDEHMADMALSILNYYQGKGRTGGIVWAHNTHIGDARYTDMADQGEVNLGQLLRERLSEDKVYIIGFSTYKGKTIASNDWNGPITEMIVPEAIEGSWDETLHRLFKGKNRIVIFSNTLSNPYLGQRAIGVVYNPKFEYGNYVPTKIENRYDALIFIDNTSALKPLHIKQEKPPEAPESYPSSE